MKDTFFIVDALNICKETSRGKARLSILLTLLASLKEKGHNFLCIFDESAFREFRNQGEDALKLYNTLVRDYENHFSQIRGKADEKIVALANKDGCPIISNDRFSEFRQRYPWLRDRGRLVKVSVVRKMIFSESIGVEASEYETDAEAWDALRLQLDGKLRAARTPSVRSKRTPKISFPSKRSAKRVVPIPPQNTVDEIPIERKVKMSVAGSDIIDRLVEQGFITPDIGQILKRGVDDQVTIVKTRKNEMVAVVLVIDKSGSMEVWQDDVIDGQRIMIEGLLGASAKFDIRFAQILFSDTVDYFQKFCEFRDKNNSKRPSADVKILDKNSYRPRGFTALYDAILKGVCSLTPIIYAAQEQNVALETKVCVLTDGIDEGPYGPGSGSKISTTDLEQAIKYMLNEKLVSNIILAGIGSYDYRQVGRAVGIESVIQIPANLSGEQLAETKRQIRATFKLFSKTGRTR